VLGALIGVVGGWMNARVQIRGQLSNAVQSELRTRRGLRVDPVITLAGERVAAYLDLLRQVEDAELARAGAL
jgi:hypothetical protein